MFVVLFAYGIHIMQLYIYILMICKMLSLDESLLPCSAISFSVPMFSHFFRAPKSCAPRKQTEPRKSRAVVGEVGRSQTRWLAPGSTNWAFPVACVNIEAIAKGGKTYVCEKSWQPLIVVISCHLFWNTRGSDPQSSCIWQLLWRDVLWRRHDMWTWVTKQNCGFFLVIQGRCSNIYFFAGVFSYLGVMCVYVCCSSKPASLRSLSMQYEHAVCIRRFVQTLMHFPQFRLVEWF